VVAVLPGRLETYPSHDLPQALTLRSPRELQREIADRKRIEESLRESEERSCQMAENINELFWMQEGGWKRLLYMSPAYEQVWGRSRQSLFQQPRSWIESIPADVRDHAAVGICHVDVEGRFLRVNEKLCDILG
jgi:PAS domain-containing protein